MGVYKKFNGERLKNAKDRNWSRGTWYVWKRIRGRVIHRALPEAVTKEDAETAERAIVTQAFNKRYGVLDDTLFADFANTTYLNYCQQNNRNVKAKKLYVSILTEHFRQSPLLDITPQMLRDLQWKLLRRKHEKYEDQMLSASSVNRIMSTASKILTLACEEGKLEFNPMRKVKMLREPAARNRILSLDEKERLWKALENDLLMARLVTLAVNLPLRRGQLLALTAGAVDFTNGTLSVIGSKNRDARIVPINATATATLRAMISDRQLPFPITDFRRRWDRITQAAGINVKVDDKKARRGENFTFHDLRHVFATDLIFRNVPPEVVRQIFAHSDMSITRLYMNTQLTDQIAAVRELDPKIQESEVIQ